MGIHKIIRIIIILEKPIGMRIIRIKDTDEINLQKLFKKLDGIDNKLIIFL